MQKLCGRSDLGLFKEMKESQRGRRAERKGRMMREDL